MIALALTWRGQEEDQLAALLGLLVVILGVVAACMAIGAWIDDNKVRGAILGMFAPVGWIVSAILSRNAESAGRPRAGIQRRHREPAVAPVQHVAPAQPESPASDVGDIAVTLATVTPSNSHTMPDEQRIDVPARASGPTAQGSECTYCKLTVVDGALFCPVCGMRIVIPCVECQAPCGQRAQYCSACGGLVWAHDIAASQAESRGDIKAARTHLEKLCHMLVRCDDIAARLRRATEACAQAELSKVAVGTRSLMDGKGYTTAREHVETAMVNFPAECKQGFHSLLIEIQVEQARYVKGLVATADAQLSRWHISAARKSVADMRRVDRRTPEAQQIETRINRRARLIKWSIAITVMLALALIAFLSRECWLGRVQ